MYIETLEQAQKLATEFLATKERKNYYDFECIDEEFSENVCYSNELSDKEVSKILQLKEKYPKDYGLHLDEIFDDPDYVHDFSAGQEIVSIDTDHAQHKYAVTIHELKPDGQVRSIAHSITLRDDEYIRLLAWQLFDEHLTINTLRHRDSNLCGVIMRAIDYYFYQPEGYLWIDNPYTATLDEAKADVDAIVAQKGIKRGGGYLCMMV
jgi:hypothetical protein